MNIRNILVLFGLSCSSLLRAEVVTIDKKPFSLPQTTFNVGSTQYKFRAKNKDLNQKWDNKGSGTNTFGFDIEIPYTDSFNIGVYYRFDTYRKEGKDKVSEIDIRLANFLGVFSRFQYAPFGRALNLFTRVDAGLGPTLMQFSGFSAQGAVSVGVESYLNDWIGLSLSFGLVEEWGKETLLGNDSSDDRNEHKKYKNIVLRSSGKAIILGIKTTYF